MDQKIMENREKIQKIFENLRTKAHDVFLVFVVWEGPFGELNYRSGYFEEYTEACFFRDYLEDTYSKYEFAYCVYLNRI